MGWPNETEDMKSFFPVSQEKVLTVNYGICDARKAGAEMKTHPIICIA